MCQFVCFYGDYEQQTMQIGSKERANGKLDLIPLHNICLFSVGRYFHFCILLLFCCFHICFCFSSAASASAFASLLLLLLLHLLRSSSKPSFCYLIYIHRHHTQHAYMHTHTHTHMHIYIRRGEENLIFKKIPIFHHCRSQEQSSRYSKKKARKRKPETQ